MAQCVLYAYWLAGYLGWLSVPTTPAAPCIQLAGVVRDYSSHQPLTAQLFLKTPTGRYNLGNSTNTGQFSVAISCESTALVIEKPGYRPQLLSLNVAAITDRKGPVSVIIPLIAVDERGNDRPYLQTEQTYFVQPNRADKASTRPQHNTFTISDALTGAALPAQTCFVFTLSGQKRCLTANAVGKLRIDFTEMDIVSFEVTYPGYQTYPGNFTTKQADGKHLQHTIRLMRELTLLSIRLSGGTGSCELRPADPSANGKAITLNPVPGEPNGLVACDLTPRRYTLLAYDRQHTLRGQRAIALHSGLNFVDMNLLEPERHLPAMDVLAPLDRLDSLPMLYFEQGSFKLQNTSEMTLLQVAAYLNQHPRVNIQLAGHTDAEGDERLNRSLAEYRAKVVSTFLYQHGITDDRMQLLGYGSRFPVAPSDTDENKAKNRRVAMKLIAN